MSKRKLTKRQAWRIEKIQAERNARAEKRDSQLLDEGNHNELGAEKHGLIIAHYGTQVEVEYLNEETKDSSEKTPVERQRRRCHFRSNLGSLVTGDKVVWRDAEPTGVVVAVQNRESELSRPDPYGALKTVAANIDRIMIVIAPIPKPHTQLVDRYLVAAENIGIQPVLVINKTDLIDDTNKETLNEFVSLYTELGYEVISTSTKQDEGLNKLQEFLTHYTSVFVGQSGVGKSSLINSLIPDLNLQVGAISESNQKGTHTTTTAQLFHFPQGGHLIDSPGIREFGLWHMSLDDILYGFIEFRPFIGHCKFRDCKHINEPKCAIRAAHEAGDISDYRMNSFEEL
ncbi:MAG: small ribosomal subunit biogenesis GTPase RsgA, partial [Cellvibrionaceae bacterium]